MGSDVWEERRIQQKWKEEGWRSEGGVIGGWGGSRKDR